MMQPVSEERESRSSRSSQYEEDEEPNDTRGPPLRGGQDCTSERKGSKVRPKARQPDRKGDQHLRQTSPSVQS